MEAFRYHVYLCTQEKPDNASCCAARGSQAVLEALRAELGKAGLGDDCWAKGAALSVFRARAFRERG